MCPVWAACSKPRRVVLIQGLTKTELPEAPGGAKQRITAEPSLRVQAAHLCGCCASNPDINSSKFHKTSENIYSLPVWFWQFRRRLVRFVQNDNGGTTNARTETSECIIKLYKVIWCLQSSSSLPIISGVWAQTLRHNSAMAQSDLQLPTLWQACHQSCTFSSFGFYIYCSAGRLCTTVVCTVHDQIHWIGLRENLQETMVFTIKYRVFL